MRFEKPPVSTTVIIAPSENKSLTEAYAFLHELIEFMKNNHYDTVYGNKYGEEYYLCKLDTLVTIRDGIDDLRDIHRLE